MSKKVLPPTHIYEDASARLRMLRELKVQVEAAFDATTTSKIHIVRHGDKISYYLRELASDRSGRYISKKEISTIQALLQNGYNGKVLKLLSQEIAGLESFLRKADGIQSKILNCYSSYPTPVRSLIKPIVLPDDEFASRWLTQPYTPKPIADNVAIYDTDNHDVVRSKSEENIANALFKNKIPYKYECPLKLKRNVVIYPDFTILDLFTRELVYWEHRGMMDDRTYAKDSVNRLRELQQNRIYLGQNLIITEETLTSPLTPAEIQRVIDHYFLRKL